MHQGGPEILINDIGGKMKIVKTVLLSSIVLLMTSMSCHAGLCDKIKGKPERPHTIIITSNYVEARMLAEIVQFKTGQPILLLPTGDEKDFFALGAKGESRKLTKDEYRDWIDIVHPKALLFIGNDKIINADYYDALRKRYASCRFDHADLSKTAKAIESVMDLSGLSKNFEKLKEEIDPSGRPVPELKSENIWTNIPSKEKDKVSKKESGK